MSGLWKACRVSVFSHAGDLRSSPYVSKVAVLPLCPQSAASPPMLMEDNGRQILVDEDLLWNVRSSLKDFGTPIRLYQANGQLLL